MSNPRKLGFRFHVIFNVSGIRNRKSTQTKVSKILFLDGYFCFDETAVYFKGLDIGKT
jgi:hypothetical protein